MKKKQETITTTEIYTLAFDALNSKIAEWEAKRTEQNKGFVDALVEPLEAKKRLISQLYEIETGTEFDGV